MSSTYDPGGRAGKRSCPFSFVVTVAGAANQRRGADTDDRTRQDAALCVLDGSNKGARQPLRDRQRRQERTCDGEKDDDLFAHEAKILPYPRGLVAARGREKPQHPEGNLHAKFLRASCAVTRAWR